MYQLTRIKVSGKPDTRSQNRVTLRRSISLIGEVGAIRRVTVGLYNTVKMAALFDSLAPIRFSNTQEYLPESSRLTALITRDGCSRVAPSYLVRLVRSKS